MAADGLAQPGKHGISNPMKIDDDAPQDDICSLAVTANKDVSVLKTSTIKTPINVNVELDVISNISSDDIHKTPSLSHEIKNVYANSLSPMLNAQFDPNCCGCCTSCCGCSSHTCGCRPSCCWVTGIVLSSLTLLMGVVMLCGVYALMFDAILNSVVLKYF